MVDVDVVVDDMVVVDDDDAVKDDSWLRFLEDLRDVIVVVTQVFIC